MDKLGPPNLSILYRYRLFIKNFIMLIFWESTTSDPFSIAQYRY